MLYLIHFSKPFKHAQHYRGFCKDGELQKRLDRHRAGNGAKLIRIIMATGIEWELAATFDGDKKAERTLKKKAIADICPICNPKLKEKKCQ